MTFLSGQIALVTGATRGIGRAIALRLGRDGATVVGTATGEAGAAEIQLTFDEAGVQGWGVKLDVTEAAACEAVVAAIEKRYGSVTVLVNNAGVTRDNLAMRMKDDDWDAVIDTNLKAVFRLAKLVMRGMMKARNGRIINITSVVGSSGNPGQANYTAAKAGAIGFTKALGKEVAPFGVTANSVALGTLGPPNADPEILERLARRYPAGRVGRPTDIAPAVLYLASEEASWVTGQTLPVNGGYSSS